ncbi:MAG TPA: hypothetical protein VME66_09605 [Candidatus Acidoferrales bacterium]|nr:hypothetical protein [Candidatus Acidoferrales bacterium]
MINSALRMFLRELVDFDGLRPPAALSVDEALRVYLRDRSSPEAWMLARVVVPASNLERLVENPLLRDIRLACDGQPLPVCVLINSPDPRVDYTLVGRYVYGERQPIAVRALDVPIVKAGAADAGARVHAVVQKLAVAELPYTIPVFLEMPHDAQLLVGDLLDAIARERRAGRTMLCAAVRCSGPADVVLDCSDVAFFIATARKYEIPIKANGVQAPLRRTNPQTGLPEHGLLNVFGAAVLSFAFDLDVQELTQILLDEKASNFRLDQESFSWKDHRVNQAAIFNARMSLARTCSTMRFREQADALIALEILPSLSS